MNDAPRGVTETGLLDALLDAWERNATIVVNLLRLVPPGGLGARASEGGLTVAQLFTHIHYVRLVFVEENAPEHARPTPEEWVDERDPDRIAALLAESARVVREAVAGRLAAGKELDRHFDHPILLLQLLTWHEGYHHGQIKLTLKLAGIPITDQAASPGTWGVWIRKRKPATTP